MSERPTLEVPSPPGGWGSPWPNVAEIESRLPCTQWTLVGGLMTQLHGIRNGVAVVRPTNDVDIILHVETTRGVASQAAHALESLGYELRPPMDPAVETAHRFTRDGSVVGLVTSAPDAVDVLVADHAAPRVIPKLRGHEMIAIEGGTQALRRTVNARMELSSRHTTTVSVPGVFGALMLKAAAYRADSREPERHLQDAALLLAVLDDPYSERDGFAGSDRSRIRTLVSALSDDASVWRMLPDDLRMKAQAALRILSAPDRS